MAVHQSTGNVCSTRYEFVEVQTPRGENVSDNVYLFTAFLSWRSFHNAPIQIPPTVQRVLS